MPPRTATKDTVTSAVKKTPAKPPKAPVEANESNGTDDEKGDEDTKDERLLWDDDEPEPDYEEDANEPLKGEGETADAKENGSGEDVEGEEEPEDVDEDAENGGRGGDRNGYGRDRGRKSKTLKAAPCQVGPGIPWSTIEDQALVGLVHDVGPNWELASDIISASVQIKGIFRKPKDCKEHHKCLMERIVGDGGNSPEDSGSSQPCPSSSFPIPKGSVRMLFQCQEGPMEEDTVKTHLERIVQVGQQHRSRKIQSDS